MSLLDERSLEASETVANAAMNRGRGLSGINSYDRELGLDLHAWLQARLDEQGSVAWLDVCCGEGRALLEAADRLRPDRLEAMRLLGLDLVQPGPRSTPSVEELRFVEASVHSWEPRQSFDLITCVHGLHYVGDKLGLLERVVVWLSEGGLFLGHLDLDDVRDEKGDPLIGFLRDRLRRSGARHDRETRVLQLTGGQSLSFGLQFVGADDDVGPNFSGQPSVHSRYGSRG